MKPTNKKSEVYEIKFGTRNCNFKYIGQTRRSVTACFKEHKSHTTNNHIQLSSVANPMKMKLNGGMCEHNFWFTKPERVESCYQPKEPRCL
jgi:hypothetical protein